MKKESVCTALLQDVHFNAGEETKDFSDICEGDARMRSESNNKTECCIHN